MGTTAKHPHLEMATEAQLADLLRDKTADIGQIYLEAHRLLLETLPDVVYATDCTDGMTGYGARQYGYDGWGMAALAAHAKWVSLLFMRGVDLEDKEGLLEGAGKKMRHVKLRSLEAFAQRRPGLQALIEQAARLNAPDEETDYTLA
jgi:hypothetical protein